MKKKSIYRITTFYDGKVECEIVDANNVREAIEAYEIKTTMSKPVIGVDKVDYRYYDA